ncbi:S1 family peptidase [Vibrio sp. TRT 21S02]|uniref:S1 family peptidase n=1 Tax=Vibrio sp. TRT 21S02 TaxID=3418507 RepID=UPI003CF18CD6
MRNNLATLMAMSCLAVPSLALATDVDPRIIDGTPASSYDWPYMVALVEAGKNNFDGQFCGGSFIGKRYILTAAHCVDGVDAQQIEVLVNTDDLNSGGARVSVNSIYVHGSYSSYWLDNDIAIVELSRELESHEATPVTLPTSSTRNDTPADTWLTVAGWGTTEPEGVHVRPNQLQQVDIQLVDQQKCFEVHGVSSSEDSVSFCAGLPQEGYDSCRGDSGGPIVVKSSGVQLGIVSWGSARCGEANKYGVYTNLSYYTDWIERNTSSLSYKPSQDLGILPHSAFSHTYTLANYSDNPITFNEYNFSVSQVSSITNNTCSVKGTLNSGETCNVTVLITPGNYGSYEESLYVSYEQNGYKDIYLTLAFEVANQASSTLVNAVNVPNDGVYSNEHEWLPYSSGIRSGYIGANETSMILIDGIPSGEMTFDLKVSTEYVDYFKAYINGNLVESTSGEYETPIVVTFHSDSNRLKLEYVKDGSIDQGEDGVFLTNIAFNSSTSSEDSSSQSGGDSGGGGSLGLIYLMSLLLLTRRRLN